MVREKMMMKMIITMRRMMMEVMNGNFYFCFRKKFTNEKNHLIFSVVH